jgi:hypothetical protein
MDLKIIDAEALINISKPKKPEIDNNTIFYLFLSLLISPLNIA